jgi:hypothetical protein
VTAYDFTLVVVFAGNLAARDTVPVLHFAVVVKLGIDGLDDQWHVLAFLTMAVKVTEPPEALTVLVAAPAWATTRPPKQSATLAILTAILRLISVSSDPYKVYTFIAQGSHGIKSTVRVRNGSDRR